MACIWHVGQYIREELDHQCFHNIILDIVIVTPDNDNDADLFSHHVFGCLYNSCMFPSVHGRLALIFHFICAHDLNPNESPNMLIGSTRFSSLHSNGLFLIGERDMVGFKWVSAERASVRPRLHNVELTRYVDSTHHVNSTFLPRDLFKAFPLYKPFS